MPDYDLGTARGKIVLDASSLGRASAAFTGLGKSLLGFSAVAVGGFALVVKSAADFEKIMSAVQAVTNGTDAEMKQLSDTALNLATNSAFGAKEIAGAFEDLGKAGISIEDIMGGAAEATVKLAEAAGDELPGGITQGAEIIANAMKTFEVGADQAEHFADVLVAAAASSTLSVDDIATSMRYAGPIANQLGLDIDDLSTTLAILGDRGIKGSTAGTSLRGVLLSLSPTSAKAKNQLKELGLITEDGANKFFDLEGKLKPIPEVMQLLGDATKDLSEEQKVQAFNTIFQRRAMNAALILAEQGVDGFNEYGEAIAGLSAADIAATKLDNLSGDMTILKNSVEALTIRVGLEFQDMLRGWVQSITDVVQRLNELDPKILANILKVVALTGVIAGVLGAASLLIGVVIKMYTNFKLLAEGIRLVLAAMKLLSISLLTNPYFLLIAALVLLGIAFYELYKRGGAFKDFIDGIIEALRPGYEAIVDFVDNFIEQWGNLVDVIQSGDDVAQGIGEVVDNMFGNSGKLVGPIRDTILAVQELWDDIGNLVALLDSGEATVQEFADAVDDLFGSTGKLTGPIQDIINFTQDGLIPALGELAEEVQRVFGIVWGEVLALAQSLTQDWIDWFEENYQSIGEAASKVWAGIQEAVRLALIAIGAYLAVQLAIVKFLWESVGDDLLNIVGTIWNGISESIQNWSDIIQGIISFMLATINGDWGAMWEAIKDIAGAAWNEIGNIISTATGVIRGVITGFVSIVLGLLRNLWTVVVNLFTSTMGRLVAIVADKIIDIVQLFQRLPEAAVTALVYFGSMVASKIRTELKQMVDAVLARRDEAVRLMENMPSRVLTALAGIGSYLYSAGRQLIQGMINGVVGAAGGLVSAVTSAVGDAVSGALGVLGINSPSKVFMEIGSETAEGFILGVEQMRRQLNDVGALIGNEAIQGSSAIQGTSSGVTASVQLNFQGPYSEDFPERMATQLKEQETLDEVVKAIKVGIGA